jgi:hypothetical protein
VENDQVIDAAQSSSEFSRVASASHGRVRGYYFRVLARDLTIFGFVVV